MAEKLWLVIPAYNEAATIRDLAQRALRARIRVIVVDDASTDATAAQVRDLPITLLRNESNRGKADSLWRGFEHALAQDAAAIMTLDGDGQHRPEDIPRLVEAWLRQPERLIIGARVRRRGESPRLRYMANRVANFWISWAAGHWIGDSQSGFRLYPGELLRRIRIRHDRAASFVFESEILIVGARLGFKSVAVPIPALYGPTLRGSHFRPILDIARIGRMVAWKLITRCMDPLNLYRALKSRSADRASDQRARTRKLTSAGW